MAGALGTIRDQHTKKEKAEKGMKIIRIGGQVFRVGVRGGPGSSRMTDEKNIVYDENAVQRGNPGMGHLTWRVIRTFVEMGLGNPIASIHDQGAAGLCGVLTELIEEAGGKIHIIKLHFA